MTSKRLAVRLVHQMNLICEKANSFSQFNCFVVFLLVQNFIGSFKLALVDNSRLIHSRLLLLHSAGSFSDCLQQFAEAVGEFSVANWIYEIGFNLVAWCAWLKIVNHILIFKLPNQRIKRIKKSRIPPFSSRRQAVFSNVQLEFEGPWLFGSFWRFQLTSLLFRLALSCLSVRTDKEPQFVWCWFVWF